MKPIRRRNTEVGDKEVGVIIIFNAIMEEGLA